jgi:hypothetical protein
VWSDEQVAAWKRVRFLIHLFVSTCSNIQIPLPGDRRSPRKGIIHVLATLGTRTNGIA